MTQPPGMVLGFPSRFGFILRASPVVCAADATYTLILLVYYLIDLRSLREAAQKVAFNRFRDAKNEAEGGSLFNLQNDTLARLSVFVLGPLPQIIKLYAMRGVPWTTVWASMLFSSFLALEVLVLILGRSWRELSANVHQGTPQGVRQNALQGNDTPASHLETTLGLGVAMASVGWCSCFLAVAAHAALLRDSVVSVLTMMCCSILAVWVSQIGELVLAETVLRIPVPFCVALIAYIYGRALLGHTHHLTGTNVCFVLSFCTVGPI